MITVGFVGLGRIGGQLVRNLLESGYSVAGFDIAPRPDLAAAGVALVESPAAVAERAHIILHSLPDSSALEAVIAGPEGLMHRCSEQHVIADLSAYPLASKVEAARRMANCGATLLDCQVSGTPEMLASRRGVIFASGDRAAADRCREIFDAAVDRQFFVGPFGTATRLKTANNLLVGLHIWAAAEAMAIAVESGIDPKIALEVMSSGAARSELFVLRAPEMAARCYDSKAGTLGSFAIYLDLIEEALADLRINAPLALTVVGGYREAIAAGRGDQGISCIYELVRQQLDA